ncbi:AMP-binding enzyme domain-containing protein [Ditylenchus destructor]|uniref:Long-chain-fatty-acid--CoA ligase n=1 Tax=Ditylenchus destructor TaxID=166010 RepID=A0AAD4N235_9BILA|nr:AMP-binding enzyme domain-containing protein [Ditylenchus destructor]
MGVPWYKFFAFNNDGKILPLVDPEMQTRELPDGSRVCRSLNTDELKKYRYNDVTTLYDVVRRGARVSNNGNMLGQRIKQIDGEQPYVWISYNEVINQSLAVARALRKLGQAVGQATFIGIYSRNRPEWIIVEQATYAYNNVLVPLYDTLGTDASAFIVNQTGIQVVFCDHTDKMKGLLDKKPECESLKYIVLIGALNIPNELHEKSLVVGVELLTFDQFKEKEHDTSSGEELPPESPPTSDDLCTICYTSGTTGTPKGVMLTHGNIIADCTTLDYFKYADINNMDVMISFLPLAHMFERVAQTSIYMEGGSVGFYSGDIKHLADDIKTLQPTLMPVVPRVLNRIYDKVMAEASKSKLKKFLMDSAIAVKKGEINSWVVRNNTLIDQIVFKKIRDGLGGRVKLLLTGSAPISEEVLTFIRCALGCFVVEGYGQTECVAACSITIEGDSTPGHVGVPSPCNAIKLVDVPELNYFAKDKAGEVCIRGNNVFRGYYRMEEQTREVLDADGWLHTGDIGKWTDRGTLKIIDRKKHIFKLAQGEYVAPEKIENIYLRSKYVAQCFIYGESLKNYLVGIVVPDPETVPDEALLELSTEGSRSLEDLCRNKRVKKFILDDMVSIGKSAGLLSFEQAKDVHLSPDPFTIENDLLTPTLKSKRPKLKARYQTEIDDMYDGNDTAERG